MYTICMNYNRTIYNDLLNNIGVKPVTILFGARQVGKTTLLNRLMTEFKKPLYLAGDDPKSAALLEGKSAPELVSLLSSYDLVVIDEAQKIKDIGTILKLIADNLPHAKVVASGSSSFELANKLSEPLTGRNRKYYLYPLSVTELADAGGRVKTEQELTTSMLFGGYPQIANADSHEEKKRLLQELVGDYLFKDLFLFGDIRNGFAFKKLVQLLALRSGSEIAYAELAKEVGISRETVWGYITLLEQAFIVFRLLPLYTNKTKEINKSHKIFFYDSGVRNALIGNFEDFALRGDKGAVLENFFIAEKYKERAYARRDTELHFWRNRQGAEVDFVENTPTMSEVMAYECKWKASAKMPPSFRNLYPKAQWASITVNNVVEQLLREKDTNKVTKDFPSL